MFCFQCEQTSFNTGCTTTGICGKTFETAGLQDMALWSNAELCNAVVECGEANLPDELREEIRATVLGSTMQTLTNVNFDEDRIAEAIAKTRRLHEEVRAISATPIEPLDEFPTDEIDRVCEARKVGINARKQNFLDADCFGLRECTLNGLTGTVAYLNHMEHNRRHDLSVEVCTEEERNEVFAAVYDIYNGLRDHGQPLDYYVGLAMKTGSTNVKVLELLDRSHNLMFGTMAPVSVPSIPVEGKAILLSGHDVRDVEHVCRAVKERGLPLSVYTHGELLPAHAYPNVQEHGTLKGHYGRAWQKQTIDFKKFPGAMVMTTNCLMPPRKSYRDRLFTAGHTGFEGVNHVDLYSQEGLDAVLDKAMASPGFTSDAIEEWTDTKPHLTGFGHNALLGHADTIVSAIKAGALTDIWVIGGCDGSEASRSYYSELAEMTPDSSVILTLGCGKYRLRDLELGTLGDSGIPRVLDLGQCNDAYSGVVVALKLAEALDTDIHHLPLHFAISWFEQKATAVLLSLLSLGVQNIKLGPAMPAFFTPNLESFMVENFNLKQVKLDDPSTDLTEFLSQPSK
jgi:hydroxylamine reductase